MNRHANQLHAAERALPGRSGSRVDLWRRAWARLLAVALTLALGVGLLMRAAAAEEAAPLDYQVKAAFLINFPKYVEWPAASLPQTNSPITVAIFGDDNIADECARMIERHANAGGRPLALKRVSKVEDIGSDCQILFVSKAERLRIPAILEKVKGAGVLTVGESDEFLDKGGVVNLVPRDRKIRLQVNLSAASQARLKISSRLLVVADQVKGKAE